jgi:hypothetical protein
MSTDLIINDDEKFNRAVKMAGTLAKSKIVPVHFQGKAEDIFAVILAGSEMGMQPMQSLNAFVMIQGQTAMKAQAQLAVVRSKLPNAYIKIEVDEQKLIAKCTCARSKDDTDNAYTATWDMNKAKQMGLASKQNYINQPLTMLRWRAITEALRAMFSDILLGFLAPEELTEDLPPLKNDEGTALVEAPRETMSQAMRREAEEENPIPEHEKAIGPLYRFGRGGFRNQQLKDIDKAELEDYLAHLNSRKTPKTWEKDYAHVINEYLLNYELYREGAEELAEV